MFEQVPLLPESAQDLQVPVHAVAQHAPCAQMFELQSASAVHTAPFGFFPQLEFMHWFGATQSVALLQSVRQAPLDPHVNGSHFDEPPGRQAPLPSQVPAEVSVDPTQLGPVHRVPAMNCRQWPAPSQVPSFPQLSAPDAGHWPPGLGAVPAGTGVQVPSVPVRLHATQVPAQPVLQQYPWSQ